LKKAAGDPLVKAVILKINSPGGTVTASDVIYHEVKRFRKKKNIPVIAAMMDLATSGGYYVAMAADKVIAHPTTVTGSIGVLAFRFNAKELMSKIGIQNETISAGEKKTLLYPFEPLTPEDRAILQSVIDNLHGCFKNVVTEARGELSAEQVEKLADGRIYDAKQALENKLIDSIGYIDDAIDLAKKEAGVDRARVIKYHRPSGYKNNIYSQAGFAQPSGGNTFNMINLDMGSITRNMGVRFMYIWLP
jgi:protease-4